MTIKTATDNVDFFEIMFVLASKYQHNTGALRAWIEAKRKPAPDQELAKAVIDFLAAPTEVSDGRKYVSCHGCKTGINTLFLLSHGRTVTLEPDFDPVEFWAEVYEAWYTAASEKERCRSYPFKTVAVGPSNKLGYAQLEISRVANKRLFMEGATAFLTRHGFDLDLLPTFKRDDHRPTWQEADLGGGYNSTDLWTIVWYKAMQVGGRDLWQAIVAASDKDGTEDWPPDEKK